MKTFDKFISSMSDEIYDHLSGIFGIFTETIKLSNNRTKKILKHEDGHPFGELYYLGDKLHKTDDPAKIWYSETDDKPDEVYFYLYGQELTKKQFEDKLLKKKIDLM